MMRNVNDNVLEQQLWKYKYEVLQANRKQVRRIQLQKLCFNVGAIIQTDTNILLRGWPIRCCKPTLKWYQAMLSTPL